MESFVLVWQGQTDVDTTLVKLQSLMSTKNYHELLIQKYLILAGNWDKLDDHLGNEKKELED